MEKTQRGQRKMNKITIPIIYWWCMYIINLGGFLLVGLLIGNKLRGEKQ